MRVLVAIPTIAERPGRAERTAAQWRELTPGHDVQIMISAAGSSWGDGLNDAYEQAEDAPPDVFICGSDDMIPANDQWFPTLAPWLSTNRYPAPRVDDPRFVNYGGHLHPVEDGTPAGMSSFPILRGDWLPYVFPLPAGLHYFADNLIAALLLEQRIPCVAVPSCRILHEHAREGRGAGFGNESTRLHIDTVRYTRALALRGIDRLELPETIRGHMWEQHFHDVGEQLGA